MVKIRRNDKCHCGSGKKYKKCCLQKDEIEKSENKIDINELYKNGHEITPDVKAMYDYFSQEYDDGSTTRKGDAFKIIDVSNVIAGKGSYKTLQTMHYDKNTIMLAARNEINDKIFQSKGDAGTNWMVLFQGAHQVFNDRTFPAMKSQLKSMIELRLKNQSYSY